jgi:hypothetical protein
LINCDNCGAPVSAGASDTSVTCTHCGHTVQISQAKSGGGGGGGSSGGGGSGGGGGQVIPQIVVVNASAPAPRPQPVIIARPPVIVVRRGYRRTGSMFGAIMTILICVAVYWYAVRIRNNVASSVNAAEHAGEHGGGEHKGKK